jgi:hypothetical protein
MLSEIIEKANLHYWSYHLLEQLHYDCQILDSLLSCSLLPNCTLFVCFQAIFLFAIH